MLWFYLICFFLFVVFASINGEGCGEDCECGKSKNIGYYEDYNSNQNRILGGKNSNPQDWPFVAYFNSYDHACTATILSNQWILSAAHCKGEDETVQIKINGKSYQTEPIISHEEFSNETFINDILLVKLIEPLIFSENVSSICLLKDITVPEMEVGAVAGFGQRFVRIKDINSTYNEGLLNEDGGDIIFEANELLRETPVSVRNLGYCNITNSETQFCAGGANRGTTKGDSGGPLLVIRDHRWVQYGITSLGYFQGIPGDLLAMREKSTFTKVNAYCDWIAEKTAGEITCQ
uniref:Peptidase S1 domain-containing protein n=1 Tax=Panagrolaimus superbus TaxID=310955 RepID=A0A914Z6K3_9BILA